MGKKHTPDEKLDPINKAKRYALMGARDGLLIGLLAGIIIGGAGSFLGAVVFGIIGAAVGTGVGALAGAIFSFIPDKVIKKCTDMVESFEHILTRVTSFLFHLAKKVMTKATSPSSNTSLQTEAPVNSTGFNPAQQQVNMLKDLNWPNDSGISQEPQTLETQAKKFSFTPLPQSPTSNSHPTSEMVDFATRIEKTR